MTDAHQIARAVAQVLNQSSRIDILFNNAGFTGGSLTVEQLDPRDWRDTLIDAAVFREWMAGIGRRSAYARIAHLLCEMFLKLKVVRLTTDYSCTFPITQTEVGDALGLSTVHVNRSLQSLRADRLIASQANGKLTILDWEGLKEAGEFDPTYLHIQKQAA